MAFTGKTYSHTVTSSSSRSTNPVFESKKKTSILKDNSWIKTGVNEDHQVDPQDKKISTTSQTSSGSSAQTLSKSTSATTTVNNGTTKTKTTVTTAKKDVVKSITKPEILSDRDLVDLNGKGYSDFKTEVITVKSSEDIIDGITTYTKEDVPAAKTTSYSIKTSKSSEDHLYDILLPTSVKSSSTKAESSTTSTVKTATSINTYSTEDVSPAKTSYSIQSTKRTEDHLYDTLVPVSIKPTSPEVDTSREDSSSSKTIRTVSYSTSDRNEWNSVTSPSYTRTSYTESRPIDYLSDTISTKSTTTVYASPERIVTGKDLCTYCNRNMYTDEKMILDDMNINCHASCFKCGVCNASLGNLKAGDSLWVYRQAIHCESCFGVTKSKWIC
ncbi:hypothetical protein DNTS_013847 [Danionella cerebrum]|uniref:LIM zinc-binding domain-containing protein n=1 Tax=Danionella cerebrum TaxID=2873325 RepID=A0A553P5H9_9TELE|nr:hypothetical protein DNTS_013847 [Danionella translucida]